MQISTIIWAIMAAGVAIAVPQGVSKVIPRDDSAPEGCVSTFDGAFQASITDLGLAKRGTSSLQKRADCGSGSQLMVTLKDGVLKDAMGRTGYIASNYQFQFDGPPQAGALLADGFSVCANGSLALGDTSVFYKCASGTFFNLYDRDWAEHCAPITIEVMPCSDVEAIPEAPESAIVGTKMVQTTIVTVLQDGQPQVVTTEIPIPICQIGDGQIQGHTTPCGEIPIPAVTIPAETPEVPETSEVATPVPQPSESTPTGAPTESSPSETPTPSESTPTGEETPTGAEETPAETESAPPTGGSANNVAPASLVAFIVGFIATLVL